MVRKLKATKAHTLYRKQDGSICPGGSTISKIGEDQSFLINWAWKLGLEGQDYHKVVDLASDAGSVAHFLSECWFRGDEPDISDFSKTAIDIGSQVFDTFKTAWGKQGLTWVDSEVQLVSESLSYGGTLDIIARDKDGLLVLGDLKSQPRIYGSVYRQLAGYEALWNETHAEHISRRVVFRYGKEDPKDEEIRWLGDLSKHFDVFKTQLQLYYAFRALNKK